MKLCVKKIYCPNCRQSALAREQSSNGQDRIFCSKCGQAICIGNGIYWRKAQKGESMPSRKTEGGSAGKAKGTKLSRN